MRDLSFLKDRLFAHRGYYDAGNKTPENSIVAFKRAIRYDYNIELDVRLTLDDKVVVFHDNNLKRVCGINKAVENCTYDELLKYNLFDTNYKIPLLKDVLKLIDGKVGVLIEVKKERQGNKLESFLSEILDNYNGFFAIQSFNISSVQWFKKNKKEYVRGLLLSDFNNKKNVSNLIRNITRTIILDIVLKTDFISYDIRSLPNNYVIKRKLTKTVLGWTVKSKTDYERVKGYCDNLICENMSTY